jgi:hypothetical protein
MNLRREDRYMIPTGGEAFRRAACGIVAGATLQFAENTTRIFENISIERYVLAGMKFEEMKDATVRHTVMGKSVGGSLRNFARWPTRSLTESASRINDAFASINDSAQCLFSLVRPYVH